jgi:DNA uptake protein ComE-like DNA-binding protein
MAMQWLRRLSSTGSSPDLRTRLQHDPYYRLQDLTEVRLAAQLGVKIDANKASVDDWLRLPGLSIHQARLLVQLSQGGVQFYSIEDVAAALGLPSQRLEPLLPILQFCYYDQLQFSGGRLNPNTATVEDLLTLPGLEPALAHGLVRERLANGPYQNLASLQQRLKLPVTITEKLLHQLRF